MGPPGPGVPRASVDVPGGVRRRRWPRPRRRPRPAPRGALRSCCGGGEPTVGPAGRATPGRPAQPPDLDLARGPGPRRRVPRAPGGRRRRGGPGRRLRSSSRAGWSTAMSGNPRRCRRERRGRGRGGAVRQVHAASGKAPPAGSWGRGGRPGPQGGVDRTDPAEAVEGLLDAARGRGRRWSTSMPARAIWPPSGGASECGAEESGDDLVARNDRAGTRKTSPFPARVAPHRRSVVIAVAAPQWMAPDICLELVNPPAEISSRNSNGDVSVTPASTMRCRLPRVIRRYAGPGVTRASAGRDPGERQCQRSRPRPFGRRSCQIENSSARDHDADGRAAPTCGWRRSRPAPSPRRRSLAWAASAPRPDRRMYGPESSGKSTLADDVVGRGPAQRRFVRSTSTPRSRMDPVYAAAIGVNIDELLISSSPTPASRPSRSPTC